MWQICKIHIQMMYFSNYNNGFIEILFSFQITHVLSESNHKWSGFTGTICEDIIEQLVPVKTFDDQLILICGPQPFTNTALR